MAEMRAPISLDGWQSIQTVGASACAIFILHQKIQKMAKCTFWYQLTRVVADKVQRDVKWLCVCMCVCVCVCDWIGMFQKLPKLLAKMSPKYILPIHSYGRCLGVNL